MRVDLKNEFMILMKWLSPCIVLFISVSCSKKNENSVSAKEKIEYGKNILETSLKKAGLYKIFDEDKINISIDPDALPQKFQKPESYSIKVNSNINIRGFDAAGILYGCIDLAERIKQDGNIPASLNVTESPLMKLRGTCVFLMKLGTYNYPITPKGYPFFYNKKLWLEYLDFLARNRFNYVAFWNGHPFDYFVKLDKYPETQDSLGADLIQQNHDMLKWLIKQGAKRNIKFFFEFYNIHTSVYFQRAHNLPGLISEPTKNLADYTSYCIQKFVSEFPEVGLYITAGEALDKKYSVSWVNDVLLSAIKKTGKTPTVFLRSWFLRLDDAKKITGNYPGVYFESKYNVEMIADTLTNPKNKNWAALDGNLIINIHMMANLEPFRWNPPLYIQKCLESSVEAGASGIQLYPRKPWRWPNISEVGFNEYQWKRDELWFKMWGRYAWNCYRNPGREISYWKNYLAKKFGSIEAADYLLKSFQEGADVLPAVQRLFWAGDDNHTVLTAGLMLTQIAKSPGIPFLSLEPVQRVPEFLNDLVNHNSSEKISPLKFLEEKINTAKQSRKDLELAVKYSTANKDEAKRYLLDAKAVELTIRFYYEKLLAAKYYSLYRKEINVSVNAKKFLRRLKNSLYVYNELTGLTNGYYDSISDVPASHPVPLKKTPYHWKDILPLYKQEYQVYFDDVNQKTKPASNIPNHKGLVGILFGDPGLTKPKKYFNTDDLEFNWNINPPDEGRNWSVLISGFIKSPITGKIKFYVSTKQSVILTIGAKKILEKNVNPVQSSVVFSMIKGKWYPISIDYENIDFEGSNLVVKWSLDGEHAGSIDPGNFRYSDYNLYKAKRAVTLGF